MRRRSLHRCQSPWFQRSQRQQQQQQPLVRVPSVQRGWWRRSHNPHAQTLTTRTIGLEGPRAMWACRLTCPSTLVASVTVHLKPSGRLPATLRTLGRSFHPLIWRQGSSRPRPPKPLHLLHPQAFRRSSVLGTHTPFLLQPEACIHPRHQLVS